MTTESPIDTVDVKPRLAFVGLGWIGKNRMQSVLENGCAEAVVVADPNEEMVEKALEEVPSAQSCRDLKEALKTDVDGIVLATPSGLHARQAIMALNSGKAVFCQKPLGCTLEETEEVIVAAKRHDLLLGVDLSYRHARAVRAVRDAIEAGQIGRVYAADLVFHNAYGPDKSWALDLELSGGGCIIDLGIHMVDLVHWCMKDIKVRHVTSALFREGMRLAVPADKVEDFAQAEIHLERGAAVRLTCSWHFHCGCDAVIEAVFYGTEGSASVCNVDGSFYDFRAEVRRGSDTEVLVEPPDAWGGRAVVAWAERLASDPSYDDGIEEVLSVARTIDRIYGR